MRSYIVILVALSIAAFGTAEEPKANERLLIDYQEYTVDVSLIPVITRAIEYAFEYGKNSQSRMELLENYLINDAPSTANTLAWTVAEDADGFASTRDKTKYALFKVQNGLKTHTVKISHCVDENAGGGGGEGGDGGEGGTRGTGKE